MNVLLLIVGIILLAVSIIIILTNGGIKSWPKKEFVKRLLIEIGGLILFIAGAFLIYYYKTGHI